MRYNKIAIAMALVMIAAGVFVALTHDSSTDAAASYEFKTTNISGYIGETVPVEVYLDSNPGIVTVVIIASYDVDQLDFVSADSSLSSNWVTSAPTFAITNNVSGAVKVSFDSPDLTDNTSTGTFVTLMFTIKEAAEDITVGFVVDTAWKMPAVSIISDTSITNSTITSYALPTAYIGQRLSDVTLENGYSWVSPGTTTVSLTNYTFAVSHNGKQFNLPIDVGKANITASLKSGVNYSYSGSNIVPAFSDLVLPSGVVASDVDITSSAADWNAGTTVTVTVTAKDTCANYKGSAQFTFVIQKATATISITSASTAIGKTYDTSPVSNPAYSTNGDGAVSFLWYKQGSSTPLTGAPTDVGSYSVVAVLSPGTNYLGAQSSSVSFAIAKAAGSITNISDPSKTYNGSPVTAPTYDKVGDGALTIEWYSGTTKLSTAPTNAGSYSVKVVLAEGTNYSATSGTMAFTISKATGSISITSNPSKTYNGSPASNPTVTRTGDGTVTYVWYVDGSTTPLTGAPTNAGSYSVVAKVAEGTNYLAAESSPTSFTIAKATSTVNVSGSLGRTYNGNAMSNPSYTGTGDGTVTYLWYLQGSTTPLSGPPTDAGSYSVVAVRAEGNNYLGSTSSTVNFTIAKATGSVTITTASASIGKVFDGNPVSDPSYTSLGDGTVSIIWYSGTTVLPSAPTNAGSYSVRASVAAGTNYLAAQSSQVSFTISKATASVSNISDPSKTFDNTPATAPTYDKVGDGTVTIEWYSGTTKLTAAPTNAGSYSVKVVLAAGTNYAAASGTMAFTISKATPALTGVSSTQIYTGQKLSASVITGTASTTGVASIPGSYTWDTPGRDTVLAVGDSGTTYAYTFTPTSANYDVAHGNLTVTVKAAESKVTPKYTIPSKLYESGSLPAISTSTGDTLGSISWDTYVLTVGTQAYGWTFIPDDLTNYTVKTGTATFTVLKVALSSITVTTPPAKTSYAAFEAFDTTDLVITANYNDGSTSDVTASCTFTPTELTVSVKKVTASFTDTGVTKTVDIAITVTKATPTVTPVYSLPSQLYETGELPPISTTTGDTPGTISWDAYTLTPGSKGYGWTFVPTDNANYTNLTGNETINVIADTLDHIEITTSPTNTAYADGDSFDKTGLVVTAVFTSGNTKAITDYTVDPSTLAYGDTSVTISFEFNSLTKSVESEITVNYAVNYLVNGVTVYRDLYSPDDQVTVRDNYTKAGYNTTPWVVPSDISVENGIFSMPASNVDITASQTPNTSYHFFVNYDANGGWFQSKPSTQSVTPNTVISVQFSNLPQRTGYTFAGWSTSPNDSSAKYTQSGSKSVTITSDLTFYAVWKASSPSPPPVQPEQPVTPPETGSAPVVSSDTLLILAVILIIILIFGAAAVVLVRRRGK